MEPKDSRENDGQGGVPSFEEYARYLADIQSLDRSFGIKLDPTQKLVVETRRLQPIDELDQTSSVAHQTDGGDPAHQTGGAVGGVSTAHQTGGVAPPGHQTGGVAQRRRVSGGHQTGGVGGGVAPDSYENHQYEGIDLDPSYSWVDAGDQIGGGADDVSHQGTYGVDDGHQTSGTRQNLGVPSAQQTGELVTIWYKHPHSVGIVLDPSRPIVMTERRNRPAGVAPGHQTVDLVTISYKNALSVGIVLNPRRSIVIPEQTNPTAGVSPSHQTSGSSRKTGEPVTFWYQHVNSVGIVLNPNRPIVVTEQTNPSSGVAPPHQTSGSSQNLRGPAAHQTGELDTIWYKHPHAVGIVLDGSRPIVVTEHRNPPAEVVPSHQTGGVASGHYEESGVVLDPVAADHEPDRVAHGHQTGVSQPRTHGVGHQNVGTRQRVSVQTHGVANADQTGGTNQNRRIEDGVIQETSNQGGQRRLLMMPKVPTYIRQKYNSEDYVPLVATFGPYNDALHNAPDQRLALVEEFKATAVKWFVAGTEKVANFWLDKVWYLVPDLRRCYTQESLAACSNAVLTQLLFQDACLAILVMGVANEEPEDINLLYNHLGAATVVTIIRDSFLLENQLPFWFIRDLLHSKFGVFKGEARWRKHFMVLCHGSTKSRKDTTTTTTIYWDEEAGEPAHFVEALKIAHLSGWKRENSKLTHRTIEEEECIIPFKDYYAVHSVTELKAKGINVEPNSTNSFKNIMFQSNYFSGTLKFPVDFVNYGSKAAYANIIAYEMSPGNHTQDYTMTAYIHLMKSLLQSPKDVEELQANGIIINMLGSNEQVMNLYRDIYTFGANCSSKYGEICQQMEDHYNNKTKTWLAELLHTYFRSPWTVIALFGSILVVILTFMQVYYAANQGNQGGDKGKSHP